MASTGKACHRQQTDRFQAEPAVGKSVKMFGLGHPGDHLGPVIGWGVDRGQDRVRLHLLSNVRD